MKENYGCLFVAKLKYVCNKKYMYATKDICILQKNICMIQKNTCMQQKIYACYKKIYVQKIYAWYKKIHVCNKKYMYDTKKYMYATKNICMQQKIYVCYKKIYVWYVIVIARDRVQYEIYFPSSDIFVSLFSEPSGEENNNKNIRTRKIYPYCTSNMR